MEPVPRSEIVRRVIAVVVWFALLKWAATAGNHLAPMLLSRETIARTSLQTYLFVCQIVTLVLGLGVTLALLRRRREGLGLARLPTWSAAASTVLSVPLVFVASSYIALQIALPTLLEELATRGARASQQNAGEFGRALTQGPLLVTLVWGAVIGALGEELFFRGLLWSTIADVTRRFARRSPSASEPPSSKEPAGDLAADPEGRGASGAPSASVTLPHKILAILLEGGIATVLSAALFGWMHSDLPGGVGIVRVASTTCLGLASGIVRQATGGVLACIALHATYNTIVVGSGRKWFARAEQPILEGIPNPLVEMAVIGLLAIGAIALGRALAARRARSVFVPE